SAKQNNRGLPITWTHSDNRKEHFFVVDSIERKDTEQELTLNWDGSTINVDEKGKDEVEIPAIGDFKILNAKVYQYPNQHIEIQFSDPIKQSSSSIEGLIYLSDYQNFSFTVEENIVKAFPRAKLSDKRQLVVETGVKNILGDRLKSKYKKYLTFTDIKPAVELIGEGVIMPSSDGLVFPFKSVNLSAVDVSIIKIFESNIPQFLQVNNLDGVKELRRVGRVVYKDKIDLTTSSTVDFSEWNTYSIDLASLIDTDPGSLYRVSISFRKSYSLYGCKGGDDDEEEDDEEEDDWDQPEYEDDESSSWDYYEDDYYYSYNDKENPCKSAYYNEDRTVSRNVLASNLGIIAKTDKQNNTTVTVTDLRTLEPQSGVEVVLYNYQNQPLTSVKTDAKGIATLHSKTRPFLVVAQKEKERGYLRLYDGSTLSLTWFDVGGSTIQKGIKGYIYGERGVWRPGDTLFLNFILEDKQDVIPGNHPVHFELINSMGQVEEKMVKKMGVNGFYHFRITTEDDAPTGNWIARFKVGGAVFEKIVKIETVKPNRLKIKIDFGVDKLSSSAQYIKGNLGLKWLHGAVAQNLEARVIMTLNQISTNFGKFADFVFDDPTRSFDTQEDVIFDDYVNAEGEARISTSIDVRDAAPGMLRASFKTIAFEESGDYSVDQFAIPYSPYSTYVGIKVPKGDAARNMLLTDVKHKVQVITVDENGNLVSRKGIKVKIYKISWKWWWDTSEEDLGRYSGSNYHSPIFNTTTSTKDGKGDFEFEVKYPSWGRYLVKVTDAGGHSTGKIIYIDWPGWAGKSRDEGVGSSSILTLATDKKKLHRR
ncbi:MAG: MG2 domain-containing protein, partial [Bacteroidales bacterium]|nr:MG2 domain-containing protein [Bacteroidales bacterium]